MVSHKLPAFATVVEIEDANELLKVIVEYGVVHPSINIVEVWRNNGMAFHEINIHAGSTFERRRVHANAAKVAYDEAFQFLRLHVEASDAILRVAFESHTVVDN